MGGVGKSTILRALSADEQIRHRFPDGVHIVKLGKDASIATLFRQLCRVLKDSGAEKTYLSTSIKLDIDAVLHLFESWFGEKRCAFFIDDVWSHNMELVLLARLCNIGSFSGNSVLITTRQHEIASLAPSERIIRLEPREARGLNARRILFLHSGQQDWDDSSTLVNDSIDRILDICNGLPVSLAATGKNVRMMSIGLPGGHSSVWGQYLSELEICHERLLRENVDSYGNLFATFATSISTLEKQPREETLGFTSALSFAQMFRRLCVLQKQEVVPNSMLQHLWQTESYTYANIIARKFVESGLASREAVRSRGEYIWHFSLHDSLHDFAIAEAKRNCGTVEAHDCLLKGYRSLDQEVSSVVRGTSRWWSRKLITDGYIHRNLCRHLLGARQNTELVQLLLSPQWVGRQLEVNDILYLETDFAHGMTALQDRMRDTSYEEIFAVKEALLLISEAVTLSSGFISSNIVELWFQLQGRLKSFCECNVAIRDYVTWIETKVERPLLLCQNNVLVGPGTVNTRIISVDTAVYCMVIMKDRERIACGSGDGQIFVVNVKRSVVEKQWKAHNREVNAIAVGRDGTRVISASEDKTTKVWDVEPVRCVQMVCDHIDSVKKIAVMGDGRRVISISRNGLARIWNIETGQKLSEPSIDHRIACMAMLEDEEDLVVTGSEEDKKLRTWNVTTGEQVGGTYDGHKLGVRCVAVTPDGRYAVSGSSDETLRVWDLRSQRQIGNSLKGHTSLVNCVSVSGDGRRVASSSLGNSIRVWDLDSRTEICDSLDGHTNMVTAVSFLRNVDLIVSCSWDGTVRVWDVTRKKRKKLTNRHESAVSGVAFTPDGRFVISGSWDDTLRIWDATSGLQVGDPLGRHTDSVKGVAVTPNGKYGLSVSKDKTVGVWDLEFRSREMLYSFSGHTDWIQCVAVTPQGDRVVTGSRDTTVRVWSLTAMDGSHNILEGHGAPVGRVFVSDDGLRVVSVDYEGHIFIWKLENEASSETAQK